MITKRSLLASVSILGLLFGSVVVNAAPITLPDSSLETTDGSSQYTGFNATNHRSQWLYGDSLFGSESVTITGLRLRLSDTDIYSDAFDDDGTNTYSSFRIDISSTTATSPLGEFDTNHGSDRTTVFNDSLELTYFDVTGTGPNDFLAAIIFSTPFVYDPSTGSGLLIDFQTALTSSTGNLWVDRHGYSDTASALDTGFRGTSDSLVIQLLTSTQDNNGQVPVPPSLALLGLGLVAIGYSRKRKA